jgi:hypothetical protein
MLAALGRNSGKWDPVIAVVIPMDGISCELQVSEYFSG